MARRGRRTAQAAAVQEAEFYGHPEAESLLRPDVGTQPQFKKKKPPVTYRYDSSLSQALSWDGQNPARELSVWLIGMIGKTAALSSPHAFDKPQELKRGDGQLVGHGPQSAGRGGPAQADWQALPQLGGHREQPQPAVAHRTGQTRKC